jgi:hypothetical protein
LCEGTTLSFGCYDAISALEINSAAVSLAETNNFFKIETLYCSCCCAIGTVFYTKRLRFRDVPANVFLFDEISKANAL